MKSLKPRKSGVVLVTGERKVPDHERAVHHSLAVRIATLLGTRFIEEPESYSHDLYYLPSRTLIGPRDADQYGISTENDFYGGWVTEPFMATKAISHPLAPGATAPAGWTPAFVEYAGAALLPGWTVFNLDDARRMAIQMLQRGPVRFKPVLATAGRGQKVISNEAQIEPALNELDARDLASVGLVLEENLTEVQTFSVGQVRLAGMVASYYGSQRLTQDNAGAEVYGGSDLTLVKGDYEALLALAPTAELQLAIEQARLYEQAAEKAFAPFVASRRNYDIARGRNAQGEWISGVMEQSWRAGGASSAEIIALEAFAANPSLTRVKASTYEVFGEGPTLPPDAILFYQGDDDEVGRISKFARLEIIRGT